MTPFNFMVGVLINLFYNQQITLFDCYALS